MWFTLGMIAAAAVGAASGSWFFALFALPMLCVALTQKWWNTNQPDEAEATRVFAAFTNAEFSTWAWGPPTVLPGIGPRSEARLKRAGFATPLQVFGRYLEIGEEAFTLEMRKALGHNPSVNVGELLRAFQLKRSQKFDQAAREADGERAEGATEVYAAFASRGFAGWAWTEAGGPLPGIGKKGTERIRKVYATPLEVFGAFLHRGADEAGFAAEIANVTGADRGHMLAEGKGLIPAFRAKREQLFG